MLAARVGTRNDTLNDAAFALGQLVAAGALGESQVHAALVIAATATGLPEDEARRTIASGMRAGVASPRTAA